MGLDIKSFCGRFVQFATLGRTVQRSLLPVDWRNTEKQRLNGWPKIANRQRLLPMHRGRQRRREHGTASPIGRLTCASDSN